MAYQTAIRLNELPPNSMREVTAAGTPILIVRDGDRVYAVGAHCRHAGGPLVEGTLRGRVVTCPWHGTRWNVGSGRALYGPYGIPILSHLWALVLPRLPTYLVRIDNGSVLVDVGGRQAQPMGVRVAGAGAATSADQA
jgi:nitrite reductase/ring-hydroxylating ferredoxin subunit